MAEGVIVDVVDMTDDEFRECLRKARKIALLVGSMHAYWDVIFDAEAILAGQRSQFSRKVVEQMFREMAL